MLAATADRSASSPAVIDGETRLSYGELLEEARRFGAALVASGIEPQDHVAIWAPNSAHWVVAVLGIFQAGAVLVPVNTRYKGDEAADILLRSRARALVTVTDFLGTDYVSMLGDTPVELPDLATIVVVGGTAPVEAVSWDGFLARATDDARAEVDRRSEAVGADDRSDILFTSGTTGVPKGVVQTHGRTLHVATDWVAMTGLAAGDRYLMVNPYFHMFGLKAGILAAVSAGATMLPQPVFDVDRVLARVGQEGVTVLPGPPTLYQAILDHPGRDRYDLSTLRVAVTGAADIPVELIRRLHDELPFSTIITGYGLTEGGTAVATSPGDDVATIATTVGRPRPGFELRIVDDRGHDVQPGEAGEIVLRGRSIMSGYLDDPEATAEAFAPGGWLRTGDLGVVDPSGCLRIVGRSKDMFIVGGFNAYPAEIENGILRHPEVRQAAVIGVPDERLGEVGMAFVVTGPSSATTGPEISEWCRGQMANFKVPRVVEVVDELPRNATGKVLKDVLRDRARRRSGTPT
ncbi:MAG TPA: FadD3 family acyl-CoA ligase [Acidimicrobiales bacterium]|jgi:acyl-CoA synthetase (AMP-forming)/AMP-acid ligase II|nr:FadD3 family acyl-CoA ligase [Acidimicrobiales bacterium]